MRWVVEAVRVIEVIGEVRLVEVVRVIEVTRYEEHLGVEGPKLKNERGPPYDHATSGW